MIEVRQYILDYKEEWDEFVSQSKSATFLHRRSYMDYHKDRFHDYSIMIHEEGALVALLPANKVDKHTIISHQGLTYGGFILHPKVKVGKALLYIYSALEYLYNTGIKDVFYKALPKFYASIGIDEIDYTLFIISAELYRTDISLAIHMASKKLFHYNRRRLRGIKKAISFGIKIQEDKDLQPFWEQVLIPNRNSRFGVNPVHNIQEITCLKNNNPSHIRQFSAYLEGNIVAGTTMFETEHVAHIQYAAINEKGKESQALDLLLHILIEDVYKGKEYFDFGIVNKEEGKKLNHGLLEWKEEFGAKAYAHHFYRIKTENYRYLENVLKN